MFKLNFHPIWAFPCASEHIERFKYKSLMDKIMFFFFRPVYLENRDYENNLSNSSYFHLCGDIISSSRLCSYSMKTSVKSHIFCLMSNGIKDCSRQINHDNKFPSFFWPLSHLYCSSYCSTRWNPHQQTFLQGKQLSNFNSFLTRYLNLYNVKCCLNS